jgi:hypothetical protein
MTGVKGQLLQGLKDVDHLAGVFAHVEDDEAKPLSGGACRRQNRSGQAQRKVVSQGIGETSASPRLHQR